MPAGSSSRVWFALGSSLAVCGGGTILYSLVRGADLLWIGVCLIAAGSLALRRGIGTYQAGLPGAELSGTSEGTSPPSPDIEPELLQPAPRRVTMTGRGKFVVSAWVLTLAAFGSLVHQHFARLAPPAEKGRLESDGLSAEATVHSLAERSFDNGRTLYFVGYNFTTAEGIPLRVNRSVPMRLFLRLAEGDTMEVVYAAVNPEIHYLPDLTSPVSTRLVFFASGLLLAAAGFTEAQRRLHRRLVATGTPVSGFTADVRRRGGVRSFRVNYDAGGMRGSLKATERNPDLHAGQAATVLFNPAIPSRAVIYRLALYRAIAEPAAI